MIKINRTTEYGLMALRHMSRHSSVTSAREIADAYGLPFEITAKTLQRLKDTGLIQSAQGSRGGYTLQRSLEEVNLAEFLDLMEGPQGVVTCSGRTGNSPKKVHDEPAPREPEKKPGAAGTCDYRERCEIKHMMSNLNQRVYRFLQGIRLAEITEDPRGFGILSQIASLGPASAVAGMGEEP